MWDSSQKDENTVKETELLGSQRVKLWTDYIVILHFGSEEYF